jgi:hypothetical protein
MYGNRCNFLESKVTTVLAMYLNRSQWNMQKEVLEMILSRTGTVSWAQGVANVEFPRGRHGTPRRLTPCRGPYGVCGDRLRKMMAGLPKIVMPLRCTSEYSRYPSVGTQSFSRSSETLYSETPLVEQFQNPSIKHRDDLISEVGF